MKVSNSTITFNNISDKKLTAANKNKVIESPAVTEPIKYAQISFGAIYNVKSKKVDIDAEKNKLTKQMDEILKTDTQDGDISDILTGALTKALLSIRTKLQKQQKIMAEIDALSENKTLTPQQKLDKANAIRKEYNFLMKQRPIKKQAEQKPKQDETLDLVLINRFRSAISEDDFDLERVFKDYFSDLNNITSVKELNEKYPKIKTPSNPKNVISKKIENSLTRDFYEDVDEFIKNGSDEDTFDFVDNKIKNIIKEIAKNSKIDENEFYKQIALTLHKTILKKYISLSVNNSFSSVPEYRKNKTPLVSENDIKLLSVDFDKFVLYVIKNHYLNSQKINDIKYTQNDITINTGSLKEPEYKFEKIPEKIKKMVTTAQSLKTAQRDYDNFDKVQLKNRLNFFANTKLGNNENVLENIISFDTCRFTQEDIKSLTQFLRIMDEINDGEKSIEDGLLEISKKELTPKGTEKLNEIEKQKAAEIFKAEQKKTLELNFLRREFDKAINLLYMNNLNNIANICTKYRPKSLDAQAKDASAFLTNLINENLNSKDENSVNKEKLEANIMRWDTYNFYKKEEPANPIFKKAVDFAKDENGKIDIDKAGKYIINSEIVENYPDSLEFVKYPDLLEKIIEKTDPRSGLAVKYLCRLDDYNDLSKKEKTYIANFADLFDSKDSVDKAILRYIIENEYIKSDTSVLTNINEKGNETVPSTICAKAKQQIAEKYKFPLCIEFLMGFEEALSSIAKDRGTSGIKKTNRNNKAIEYKMELKLMGHDDRLFSSNNDYCFDIFSDKGIH